MLKLQYLKGSKEMGLRLWNVLEPKLPEYNYLLGYPTFGLRGLHDRGLI